MGCLLSVNVGLPQDVAWTGKTVHTGIPEGAGHGFAHGTSAQVLKIS
jgi:hypothetical protein